jgi:hypothetical protein
VRFHSVVIASAIFISACGSASKGSQSPSSDKNAWLATLIDESQDSQFKIRPQDTLKDPTFGPILQNAEAQATPMLALMPGAKPAMDTFQKSELLIISVRKNDPADAVIIFEGVPDTVTVDTMNDPSGQPLFKKVEGSTGNAVEYDRNKGESADNTKALRLVTLHQMWIVGIGPAADRLHAAATSGKMEELHADSGPLFSASGVGDVIESAKKGDHPPQIQPAIDGLSRIDLQVEGGQTAHLKMAMTYADENAATTAQHFVQTTLDGVKAQKPDLKPTLDQMTLARDKAKVTFDAPLPADFIQAVMQSQQPQVPTTDAPPSPSGYPQPSAPPSKPKKKKKSY